MIEDFQNAFVRILADSAFRTAFFANPDEVLQGFALTGKECKALLGIPAVSLERYAASLLVKRAEEFSRAVPLTIRISPGLATRYKHWLKDHPSPRNNSVLAPGLSEALRVLPFLAAELARDPSEAPYSADLYMFEVMRRSSFQDCQVRHMKSRYRTDLLVREIRKGWIPMDPDEFPVLFRFDESGAKWKKQ